MLLNSPDTFGCWKDKDPILILNPHTFLVNPDLWTKYWVSYLDETNEDVYTEMQRLYAGYPYGITILQPRYIPLVLSNNLYKQQPFAFDRNYYRGTMEFYKVYDTKFITNKYPHIFTKMVQMWIFLKGEKSELCYLRCRNEAPV